MAVKGFSDAGEGVESVLCAASFFEAGDDGLGWSHACGELALAQPGCGAEVVDELSEGEVVLLTACYGRSLRSSEPAQSRLLGCP